MTGDRAMTGERATRGYRRALAGLVALLVGLTFGLDLVALMMVFQPPGSSLELLGLAAGINLLDHVAVAGAFGGLALLAVFYRRTGHAGLVLLFCLLFFSRVVQLAALYHHGGRLPAEAFSHLELLPLFFTARLLLALGAGALVLALVLTLCLRALARAGASCERSARLRASAWAAGYPVLLISLLAAAVPRARRDEVAERFAIPTGSPELAFAAALGRGLGGDTAAVRRVELSKEDRRELAGYGIAYGPARARYPLVKERVFERPLPFARRAGAYSGPANVVLLLLEGLSAELLGAYNTALARHRSTPNLDRFARQAMVVEGHYAHAATTVGGLRGQLCSYYPTSDHRQWQARRLHRATTLLCLPRVLRRRGYRAVYLSHGNPQVSNLAAQAVAFGFEESLFRPEIARGLLGAQVAPLGDLDDGQMARAFERWLERRARGGDRRPFFVAISTLDTHPPYARGGGDGSLAETLAATDRAFATIWRALQRSSEAKRTILVVTADHAQWPSAGYRALVGPRARGKRHFGYGPIALLIHDPRHALPGRQHGLSSSVDLAPTVLHLLGVDARNPFQGRSLFDRHSQRGGVFGATRSSGYVLQRSSGFERGFSLPLGVAAQGEHPALGLFVRWHAYQHALIAGNRIWHRALER